MKIVVAAVQMPAELVQRVTNLELADNFLREARDAGSRGRTTGDV